MGWLLVNSSNWKNEITHPHSRLVLLPKRRCWRACRRRTTRFQSPLAAVARGLGLGHGPGGEYYYQVRSIQSNGVTLPHTISVWSDVQ